MFPKACWNVHHLKSRFGLQKEHWLGEVLNSELPALSAAEQHNDFANIEQKSPMQAVAQSFLAQTLSNASSPVPVKPKAQTDLSQAPRRAYRHKSCTMTASLLRGHNGALAKRSFSCLNSLCRAGLKRQYSRNVSVCLRPCMLLAITCTSLWLTQKRCIYRGGLGICLRMQLAKNVLLAAR